MDINVIASIHGNSHLSHAVKKPPLRNSTVAKCNQEEIETSHYIRTVPDN